ncbi:hypothetical protein EVAR_64165_1, partial [Eumeta japonica]
MLDLLKQENPVYCGGLIDIIKESILNRFEKYNLYDTRAKDSILAAVSYPLFKLKWVPRTEKEYVKELFIAELRRFKQEDFKSAHPQTSTLKKKQKSESYYMFNDSDSSTTSTDGNSSTCTDLETLQYLRDEDTSLNILNTYPTIKSLSTIQHLSPEFGTSGTAVFRMVFERGRTNLTDALRDRRPSTLTTDDVCRVRLIIETSNKVTYQQIRTSLGIGNSSLMELFGMPKFGSNRSSHSKVIKGLYTNTHTGTHIPTHTDTHTHTHTHTHTYAFAVCGLFYSGASVDGVEKRSLVPRSRSHARLRRNATMSHAFSYGLTGKTKQKKQQVLGQRYHLQVVEHRELIIRARAEALVHNGKSAVMGRGPEIGFQNVTLAVPVEEIAVDNAITSSEAEIVIVPVEQEALNQSRLSRTPAQQFLLLVVFCLHDQIPKMKMQSHQEQLDV